MPFSALSLSPSPPATEDDDDFHKKLAVILTLNRAYQETVQEKLKKLNELLIENLQKQVKTIRSFKWNFIRKQT